MKPFEFRRSCGLKGKVSLPGDKSIAHRAIMLSCLASGKTAVYNFPQNEDCLATINSFKALGTKFKLNKSCVFVSGRGSQGLVEPKSAIFIKESGTTFRLLLGVLAGLGFKARLNAGASLSRRPMSRVILPLRRMGVKITAKIKNGEEYPPLTILRGNLKGINYKLPIASAQVKSAILLAGLSAKGTTKVIEPFKTRDHTERMLKLFKADLRISGKSITVKGGGRLISPKRLYVPGDLSSAAFFMVGASIIPGSALLIKNVSLNPGRSGVVNVLKRMGAKIKIKHQKIKAGQEPMGDITVKYSKLKGAVVKKKEIPFLIDEIPVLMVAACIANGKTTFEGVNELRVKETDRIFSMTNNLSKMGARIKVTRKNGVENIVINGVKGLNGAKLMSFGDHRTAMSLIIAGLAASGNSRIDDLSCINKSFPEFLRILKSLS